MISDTGYLSLLILVVREVTGPLLGPDNLTSWPLSMAKWDRSVLVRGIIFCLLSSSWTIISKINTELKFPYLLGYLLVEYGDVNCETDQCQTDDQVEDEHSFFLVDYYTWD